MRITDAEARDVFISRRKGAKEGEPTMKKTVFVSRVLAFILTLAMLVSFAGAIPFITASAADPSFDGYIYNGDFETGTKSPWTLNSGSSIVAGGHNGSAYALRVSGGQWSHVKQVITVEPNTDYRLSGWVKRETGTGAHYLYANNGDGGNFTAINGTKQWFVYTDADWVYHKWEFNSGNYTSITLYMMIEDANSVFLYDDITLAPLPKPSFDGFISNGDFEVGDTNGWTLNSGSRLVEGGHNGSGYAIRVAGSLWSHVKQTISVEPNTEYRLSGWVKRDAGTGTHYLYAQGPNNEKIASINGTHNWFNYMDEDWVYHKWEFNSGDFTSITVYLMVAEAESAFIYDDISMKEIGNASFDGYISNGDFELGDPGIWSVKTTMNVVNGGYNSEFALRVAGSQWSSASQLVNVEEHTDYRLSAWVKREAGTGAHYLTAKDANSGSLAVVNGTKQWFTYTGDEWVQHVYEFNSGSNSQIKVYIQIEDANSVFLYDNITLEKLGTASFDGFITNGDLETGRDSGWVFKSPTAVVEGGRNGSAYALSVAGKAGAAVTQDVLVDGLTDYRITVHAKRVSGSGADTLSVKSGNTVIEPINGTEGLINPASGDWEEFVFDFNSGKTAKVTVGFTVSDSNTVILFDDITMAPILGPDYSDVIKGDVTLDGKFGKDDATLLQQHLDGEVTLEGAAAYAADLDCDGSITAADLALLRKYISGEGAAVPLYPINGETVAKGSWQVEELLVDYTPGKSDAYSGVPNRKDQYARDAVVLRWLVPSGGARSYSVYLADNPGMNDAKRYQIQNDNIPGEKTLSIQNLLVDTDYYWMVDFGTVASDVGTFHTAKTVRTLWIEGVSNTRDIGGWLTEDGEYRVKYNVAFRGAKFDDVTEDGKQAILDLGLKTDVDLRGKSEGVDEPLADIGITHIFGNTAGCAMYNGTESTSLERLETDHVKGTVNAIRTYADPANYPAYFHCSYGRDRTGTVGMFLLGLLGVSRDDILKDYEMTFLSAWGGSSNTATGHTSILIRTMNWLVENYSTDGTLKDACEGYLLTAGLTDEEIASIRANMLEPVNAPAPVATGIAVTTLPTKTTYLEGKDGFVADGGVITVSYSDGSSEEVALTADMVSALDNTVVGPQTLTVTYGEFTATFDVEIIAKSMTRIAVTVLPTKTEYEEGEEFDPTGIEVTAYYDNDTQTVLTAEEYVVSGFESTVGEHTITVSVGELTDTFTVNVSRKLKPGDPDGDGVITVSDALMALRVAAKLAEETPDMLTCCDVDGDGEITVADALDILRVAVGLKDAF